MTRRSQASPQRGPGDTRLFRDHDVLSSGLVGVRLPGMHGISIVSQGCRPIGHPYIVTAAEDNVITELGGRPPLVRLREIVEELPRDEQELVSRGLQIGIVVDEHLAAPGQGDFMIRGLLGADPSTGAIEDLLGGIPRAGFFAAGEIGPIAGRNALHGFTASTALFVDDAK